MPLSLGFDERSARRALIIIALGGLILGLAAYAAGHPLIAGGIWAAGTLPVVIGLALSIIRDLAMGRLAVSAQRLRLGRRANDRCPPIG